MLTAEIENHLKRWGRCGQAGHLRYVPQASRLLFCNGYILLCYALMALSVEAQTVRVWQTRLDDGSKREQKLEQYGVDQDNDYMLLAEQPPLEFQNESIGADRSIVINPERTYQTIQGLGASMTDSSAWVLAQLKEKNPQLYTFVMQRFFSEEGAGFSMLRRPVGSSDYTATGTSYTYQDDPARFSIGHDKEYIIPMLREAKAINPSIRIVGSPWSAPAWMKSNGDLNGISAEEKAAGKTNRLKPECFDAYADYFVNFIKGYAAEGVTVNAVTLQNEPQFDAAAYPCMRMTVDDQIGLVRTLGPKIMAAGLGTEIFVHDHNWLLHPNDKKVIGGDAKMDPFELVKKICSDPVAGQYVAGSAWHCYSGSAMEMKRLYEKLALELPDKKIYCTEATGWRDETKKGWLGDCAWGLKHNWLGGLAAGASVGLQWNLALDHKHGPTTRDDSLAVGLVTVNTDTWNSAKFEREFYCMAHVSRAVRPGSVRLHHIVKNGGGNILVLAVQRPDGSQALVVCNQNKDDRSFEVRCGNRFLKLKTPARSIQTLTWF
ncbi:glycoside hydrolase family 30 protein [Pontiella sulfatireligans]|uniref:glycoside hydrolase family 30 protein n=1 Tax=Pontiella sulfatireligans TaxID=2750658 RepID=UPI00109C4C3B|nr:glycoside hydrolase family 30 beta sandwich domain-containing protein [Pontiella sulfatireligans]